MAELRHPTARQFLRDAGWKDATCEPLTGDASVRKYFRLSQSGVTAVLMDATAIPHTVIPFIQVGQRLRELGFSAPEVLARDESKGFLLLEDFGDQTFAGLLENGAPAEELFALAIDVLVALHQKDSAAPLGWRAYAPEKMLADLELFLDWCAPKVADSDKAEFRAVWREVLPLAHAAPRSLLLRDYHAANLMLLSSRSGVQRAGLLDFQDAYQGPVTYDLVSLLEDARRDVPADLRARMLARYSAHFPCLPPDVFATSLAIVAALRHTRVLGIFERLSQFEGKHEYQRLHSARVQHLLNVALRHPALERVRHWIEHHAS